MLLHHFISWGKMLRNLSVRLIDVHILGESFLCGTFACLGTDYDFIVLFHKFDLLRLRTRWIFIYHVVSGLLCWQRSIINRVLPILHQFQLRFQILRIFFEIQLVHLIVTPYRRHLVLVFLIQPVFWQLSLIFTFRRDLNVLIDEVHIHVRAH